MLRDGQYDARGGFPVVTGMEMEKFPWNGSSSLRSTVLKDFLLGLETLGNFSDDSGACAKA